MKYLYLLSLLFLTGCDSDQYNIDIDNLNKHKSACFNAGGIEYRSRNTNDRGNDFCIFKKPECNGNFCELRK